MLLSCLVVTLLLPLLESLSPSSGVYYLLRDNPTIPALLLCRTPTCTSCSPPSPSFVCSAVQPVQPCWLSICCALPLCCTALRCPDALPYCLDAMLPCSALPHAALPCPEAVSFCPAGFPSQACPVAQCTREGNLDAGYGSCSGVCICS